MRRNVVLTVLAAAVGALVAVPMAGYAGHQFTDVPNTSSFHADIDWLASTGVTKGCGANTYCPKDDVTREQMAAFMRRLSGNDPNVAPSVNAAQLDGFTASQLAPLASFESISGWTEPLAPGDAFGFGPYIDVPASGGVLLINGGIDAHIFDSDDVYSCELTVAGKPVAGSKRLVRLDGQVAEEDCQTSGGLAGLTQGRYWVELLVTSATGKAEFREGSVTAVWLPIHDPGTPSGKP